MSDIIQKIKSSIWSKPVKKAAIWGPLIIAGFFIAIPLGFVLVLILAATLYRDLKKAIKEASNTS